MARLTTLLIMLSLALTSGAGVASAICQHQDERAHVAALESADAQVSATAHDEEAAAAAASKKAAPAEASGGSLAGFMLPPSQLGLPDLILEPAATWPGETALPPGRSESPLLEPPSA